MLIDLNQLEETYRLKVQGVLHIGGHHAEELELYEKVGASKVIWVEGNPETFEVLMEKIARKTGHSAHNLLVSDKDGQEVNFNVASFSQSSSMLEFGSHSTSYPDITVSSQVKLKTVRLDNFFTEGLAAINFLNLDIQGAELMALKGMGDLIESIEYIYTEINLVSVYKGGARLHQIDRYLGGKGFLRVETSLTKANWGDAFYVRVEGSKLKLIANIIGALILELKSEVKTMRDRFYKFRKGIK